MQNSPDPDSSAAPTQSVEEDRSREKPAAAFERIYRRHIDAVFRYAVRCAGRREIAEELASEAFLTLYRHIGEIDQGRLPAWLFTVVKNLAMDYWRHKGVEERHSEALRPEPATQENKVEKWILEDPSLKPAHRACLILRYIHGMDRLEIVKRTGLTDNQVKSNLQYGLTLLRKRFAE